MNPVFATRAFWQSCLTLEPKNVSASDLAAQLDELRGDFTVREETISFECAGQQNTAVQRTVEFPFFCGDRFSLVIEYNPDVFGCDTYLFLVNKRSGTKQLMGWSDLARWHPYCLHPDELDALLEFWRRRDDRWAVVELPLLLLCQFVGLATPADLETLQRRADAAYRALGLTAPGESLQNVPFLHVPEAYRWEIDAELGWVFTSDEYCCYSLRNRPHAGSDEGRFPFTAFREMMGDIRKL